MIQSFLPTGVSWCATSACH